MYVQDELALFFKRLFLLTGMLILVISVEFANQIAGGISEFYALILFALAGMMLAASANDFVLVFVALELITVTFYVLNSFQRDRAQSLEAGVNYLILGALSSAFLIYGVALVFGTANTTNFTELAGRAGQLTLEPLFLLGLLVVPAGLGFKLAATMTLAMVSLAGVPPLAGFFGKFLLLKAVAEHAPATAACYCLLGVAILGVVISLCYYFRVVRAMYWSPQPTNLSTIEVSSPIRATLGVCVVGMLYLGLFPNAFLKITIIAVSALC
jgi:NADH:ubiquinone oxidoreductase subunit 2 (subunit N)